MRITRVIVGGGVGVAAVFVIALAGATSFWTKCYDPSLMASWVQAVGAVAAIMWAGKFTNDQLRAQRELQKDAAKSMLTQRLESFIALCEVARAEVLILDKSLRPLEAEDSDAVMLMSNVEKIQSYAFHNYEAKTFDGLAAALNAFPIHELPNARSVGTAQRFRDGFMHTSKAIAEWVSEFRKVQRPASAEASRFFMAADYLYSQYGCLEKLMTEYKQS